MGVKHGRLHYEETTDSGLENRALRRLFGRVRKEKTGDRRELHSEELHNVFCSAIIIRVRGLKRMR
jgi:hypothetical protein